MEALEAKFSSTYMNKTENLKEKLNTIRKDKMQSILDQELKLLKMTKSPQISSVI